MSMAKLKSLQKGAVTDRKADIEYIFLYGANGLMEKF